MCIPKSDLDFPVERLFCKEISWRHTDPLNFSVDAEIMLCVKITSNNCTYFHQKNLIISLSFTLRFFPHYNTDLKIPLGLDTSK